MKVLEIIKDGHVNHTRYWTMSKMSSEKCFEGNDTMKPLKQAKSWAKDNGYTHLTVISTSLRKSDKTYTL